MCSRFQIHGRRLVRLGAGDQSFTEHYYPRDSARLGAWYVSALNRHANQISRDRWCGSGSTIRVRDVP